jgi:hypothetical protein
MPTDGGVIVNEVVMIFTYVITAYIGIFLEFLREVKRIIQTINSPWMKNRIENSDTRIMTTTV